MIAASVTDVFAPGSALAILGARLLEQSSLRYTEGCLRGLLDQRHLYTSGSWLKLTEKISHHRVVHARLESEA
jgi:hypothetical protein